LQSAIEGHYVIGVGSCGMFTTTIVNQVPADVTRPSMNHPNQNVFVQIATSHWLQLECATRSTIPRSLRSIIDAEQIVNDSIDDWIKRVSEAQSDEMMEQRDIDSLIGLLMIIAKRRTTDAIRKEISWKRGGRTITGGEEILDRCQDSNCIACTSAIEFEEMLCGLEQHLDATQQSVLRLRLDGYTEWEIAERLQVSLDAVKGIRRSIVSIANAVMPDAHPEGKKQEARSKKQEARKNSFEKWEFFQRRTRRLRLTRSSSSISNALALEIDLSQLFGLKS
jgi:DNA-directed RNA polymerase specialized sigma24 family protein